MFGLKKSQDLENWAAHRHQEFPGGTPPNLVFFEAELRFGVKVISPLTQPHNRQDGPNTPDYYRAHCLLLLFSFYE